MKVENNLKLKEEIGDLTSNISKAEGYQKKVNLALTELEKLFGNNEVDHFWYLERKNKLIQVQKEYQTYLVWGKKRVKVLNKKLNRKPVNSKLVLSYILLFILIIGIGTFSQFGDENVTGAIIGLPAEDSLENQTCYNQTVLNCTEIYVPVCINQTVLNCSKQCDIICGNETINGKIREVCSNKCFEVCLNETVLECKDKPSELCVNETVLECVTELGIPVETIEDDLITNNSINQTIELNETNPNLTLNESIISENLTEIKIINETTRGYAEELIVDPINETITDSVNETEEEILDYNLSFSIDDNLGTMAVPVVDTLVINSTTGLNYTEDNLTVYFTVSDGDSDPIKNITNWYKDGTSITVLNMPFEGGSNETYTKDYSSYTNNGIVTGAIWNATGGYDGFGAYEFGGSDYLQILDMYLPYFTVSTWFNTTDKTANQRIISKTEGGEWHLSLNENGACATNTLCFLVHVSGTYYDATVSRDEVSNGVWHYAVGTYDGETVKLYLDGQEVGSDSSPSGVITNIGNPICIGEEASASACDGGNNFVGAIDEVKIFNYSLTSEQILALYQNKTDLIVSQEISIGDNWSACVTPNDGTEDGTEVCSNNLTVLSAGYDNCPDSSGMWVLNSNYTLTDNIDCNEITVQNGAYLIVADAYNITTNNLTVKSGSYIYADEFGCPGSQSPDVSNTCYNQGTGAGYGEGQDGYVTGSGGGGYGGSAGSSSGGKTGGYSYGSVFRPYLKGSGSGAENGQTGEAGGGAIRITVSDTFNLTGSVTANGADGINAGYYTTGSGSGGSVWVTTETIIGNGSFIAEGGPTIGWHGGYNRAGGAGGGGRIAVYFNESTYTGMSTSSVAGGGGSRPAEDGTLVFIDLDDNNMWIVDGMEFNQSDYSDVGTFKPTPESRFNFNEITVVSSSLRISSDTNITIPILNLSSVSTFTCDSPLGTENFGFKINTSDDSIYDLSTAVFNTSSLIISSLSFSSCNKIIIFENVSNSPFLDNSVLTVGDLSYNNPILSTITNLDLTGNDIINLSITGNTIFVNSNITSAQIDINALNLTLDSDSTISANYLGCPSSQSPNENNTCSNQGSGPGYGEGQDGSSSAPAGGGSYGGRGGTGSRSAGYVYGSTLRPNLKGSGGGSNIWAAGVGGGTIRMNILDTFVLNGTVTANGHAANSTHSGYVDGGGSGGSIWVNTNTLTGVGNFSAKGGNRVYSGSGGGGGRIAIYFNESTLSSMSTSSVSGGSGGGSAGTLFFLDTDDNNAWIVSGMEFNQSDYSSYGSFKPTVESQFNFNNIQMLTSSVRLSSDTNVTVPTLNMSSTNIITCDSLSETENFGFQINTSDDSIYSLSTAVFNVNSILYSSPLTFSSCNLINIFENTSSPQLIADDTLTTFSDNLYLNNPSLVQINHCNLSIGNEFKILNSSLTTINNSIFAVSGDLNFSNTFADLTFENTNLTVVGEIFIHQDLDNFVILSTNIINNLNLTINNLTLDSDSTISANYLGCPSSQSPNENNTCSNQGSGPGYGEGQDGSSSAPAGGGSYGGRGGTGSRSAGYVYGSTLRPNLKGSGGGSNSWAAGVGGGTIRMNILDTFVLNGTVTANGHAANSTHSGYVDGGGSGGSIWVNTNTLTGVGNFSAKGGNRVYSGSGGGGGRIAIYFNESTLSSMSTSSVSGGSGGGSAGTLFFLDTDDNNAWIVSGMEFNQSDYSSYGIFKNEVGSTVNLENISVLTSSLIRFKGGIILNTSTINFTSSTITIGDNTNLKLIYNQTFNDLGATYDAESSSFIFSIEDTANGKIDFIDTLSSFSNLSTNLNISNNYIFINSTNEDGLNKSANITIYNFPFPGFVVGIDDDDDGVFENCDSSICTPISLAGGTAFFNVTHFTTYKAVSSAVDYPTINLMSPEDNNISNSATLTFIYNVTDPSDGITSCSLILNDEIFETDTTITEETPQNFTVFLTEITYNWSINCTDDNPSLNQNSSEIRVINLSSTLLSTTSIISPVNINSQSRVWGQVNFNDGTNITNHSLNIYRNDSLFNFVLNNSLYLGSSWWNTSFSYRCLVNLTENIGHNRTNLFVIINGSDLNGSCGNILSAPENSIRITDNNSVEIDSKLHDWNSLKTETNDSDSLIDGNDELTFIVNLTANQSKSYLVYYDLNYNNSKDYNNAKLNLYSAEQYVITGDYDGLVKYATIFRNGSFSSFSTVEDYDGNDIAGPWGVVMGDFDNDGDYDFVTGDNNGNLFLYEKTGTGNSFATKTNIGTYTDTNYLMDLAAADFNNDGNMDFVFTGNEDDYYIALGHGNNSFNLTEFDTDGPGSNGRAKDSGDFNGDGCQDFLTTTYGDANVYMYTGNCDGTFDSAIDVGDTVNGATDVYGLAVADFNKDGYLDFVVDDEWVGNGDLWDLYLGNGDGTFDLTTQDVINDGNDNSNAGESTDCNNDGLIDLIYMDFDSEILYCYVSDGNGSLTYDHQVAIGGDRTMGIAAPYPDYQLSLNISFGEDQQTSKTDESGDYNYTFIAPSTPGVYPIIVNLTYQGYTTESSQNLTVYQIPVIESVTTSLVPYHGATLYLIANITDENLEAVNFTITDPDGIEVVSNVNGTTTDNTLWNSSSFTLSKGGPYNYSILTYDIEGFSDTETGQINFIVVSETLTPQTADINQLIVVSGLANLSNGSVVSDQGVNIYLNGSLRTDEELGDGSDGSLTISSANNIINNYTYLIGNEFLGNLTITVYDASAFSAGDEILIIQMQNSSGGEAGTYEFADVSSVNGNDLTLSSALSNSYYSGTFNTSSSIATQIVRVPQYTYVTIDSGASITASAWDGYTGGIVVFRNIATVANNGSINVTGKGFRGGIGPVSASDYQWGYAGERTVGSSSSRETTSASKPNGGGGAGKGGDGSGGGGSYGTLGTDGGKNLGSSDYGRGATAFGESNLTHINFGGGGGSSGSHSASRYGVSGGAGGGVIFLFAETITLTGEIVANGAKGSNGGTVGDSNRGAGGGGGAGGTIYLIATNNNFETGLVNASGGTGGLKDPGSSGYDGGDGGDGRIRLDYTTLSGTTDPVSGYNGTVNFAAVMTNSTGHYTYNLTSPNTSGIYPILVNISYNGLYGQNTVNLDVDQLPVINSVITSITPYYNSELYLMANITDDNSISVNFTITDPDGIVVINNVNGTDNGDNTWNSSTFTLNKSATYNYTVVAWDANSNNDTETGQINFLTISSLIPSTTNTNSNINGSGRLNWSNGTPVINGPIVLFNNGGELFPSVNTLDLVSDNVTDIFIYDSSNENITDPSDDFYGSTVDTNRWIVSGDDSDGTVLIINNSLYLESDDVSTWNSAGVTANYNISGDFDVQVDFHTLTSGSNSNDRRWKLEISNNGAGGSYKYYRCYKMKTGSSNYYRYETYDGSTWRSTSVGANDYQYDTTGTLRLTRTGTTVHCYFRQGDTWTEIASPGFNTLTTDAYPIIFIETNDQPMSGTFDNFKINSGNHTFNVSESWISHPLVRMSSWYNEPNDPSDDFSTDPKTVPTKWNVDETGTSTLTSDGDKIHLITTTSGYPKITSEGLWNFTGDFDVQIDFSDIVTGSSSDSGLIMIMYTADANDGIYIRRPYHIARYDSDIYLNGAWVSYAYVGTSDTSGKFRMKRSGNLVDIYYWNSGWTWLRNYANNELAQDVYLQISQGGSGVTSQLESKIDNFKVNYGTIVGTGNFSSDVRSNQSEFPSKAIIVATNESLEIFNSTGNMWMRFLTNSTGLFSSAFGGNVYADQGQIYTNKNLPSTNVLRIINFYHDSLYATGASVNYERDDNIKTRNMDVGWTAHSDYTILEDEIQDIAVTTIGTTTYAAVATPSGLSVVRYPISYIPSATHSTEGEISAVYFDPNGVLYYANATHLVKDISSYQTSNFSADLSISLSNIVDITGDDNYLYVGLGSDGVSKRAYSDITTEIEKYDVSTGHLTTSNNVTRVLFDGLRLYVGTDSGLNEINLEQNTQVNFWDSITSQSLADDYVTSLGAYSELLGTMAIATGSSSGAKFFHQNILTDSSGDYTYNFTTPSTGGEYNITVESYVVDGETYYAENTQNLTVYQFPVIESITNSVTPYYGATLYLIANITDDNLLAVNFTITDPDGVEVVSNVNGTQSGTLWNSSSFTLSKDGTYNYTIIAYDQDNTNDTETGQIDFVVVSETLTPQIATINQSVIVSGMVNLTNGSVLSDTGFYIFLNGSLEAGVTLGWDNLSFNYRKNLTFNQPNSFSERVGEHILFNLTFDEERLKNGSGAVVYCNGTQVPFDSYSLQTSNNWVTQIKGLVELNFTGDENKSCYIYYDPNYNGSSPAMTLTGWHYVGDNARVGDILDIGVTEYDCNGYISNGEVASGGSICGHVDTFELNEWCYFKGQTTGTQSFYLASDDSSKLYLDGSLVINRPCCGGTAGSASTILNQYHALEIDFEENGGGQYVYNAHASSNTNNIDTECYPYYGDEWLITVTNSSEEEQCVSTNATGHYTYNLTAPNTSGIYPVVVNLTYNGLFGQNTQNLYVGISTPEITTPSLYPLVAYTNTNLTANTTYTDGMSLQGSVNFIWYVDGVNVYNGSVTANNGAVVNNSLPLNYFSKNNLVNVSVYANHSLSSITKNSNTITILNALPTPTLVSPTAGELLVRELSSTLNVSITDFDNDLVNVTFLNETNQTICESFDVTNSATCEWADLSPNTNYKWKVNVTDGTNSTLSTTWNFTANDEPKLANVRVENISDSSATFYWENEVDMEWVSLQVGNDIIEIRSITSVEDNWTVNNLQENTEYRFLWQTGDNLRAMSDYYSFYFRTEGWKPDFTNYSYKRLITIDGDDIAQDLENYALNLTLTEENFKYYDSSNWVWYPSFTRLNWTNYNDIRFTNYYGTEDLIFNVTYWDVKGDGCQLQQTIPNATNFTGNFTDYSNCFDGDWNTQSIPSPEGVYYYNYSIPIGAKNTSKFRIYDGGWGWDISLPEACFGGDNLEFKSVANYSIPSVITYCLNSSNSNDWILARDNANVSAYIYETMVTWNYDCEANILVKPQHFNDSSQGHVEGIEGDYDLNLWMYYGAAGVDDNQSSFTSSGIHPNFTLGAEEDYALGAPELSNINDSNGRTNNGTNISWSIDQATDNRVKYATNQWLLGATWASGLVNTTENFEHIYGDSNTTSLLNVYAANYISIINVTCSNSSFSDNYSINASANPVTITFEDVDQVAYYDWNITYTRNKTWERNTRTAEFKLENLEENTTYYYQINSYGATDNTTYESNFTLGTLPTTPTITILNYTEDRPNQNTTICVNLTNLNSNSLVNVSVQYWNQTSVDFGETSKAEVSQTGVTCNDIEVEYGNNYTYRAKAQGLTTGYSDVYENEFLEIQEFFAGSYVEDDNDGRFRQYCPDLDNQSDCYEQKGYWEGSLQDENWIWIETNISTQGILTTQWWNGTSWNSYVMTNDSDSEMQYLKITNLGSEWQTFYITNVSGGTVLNWTKPGLIHLNNQNREDVSKYVSFDGTPESISYQLLYMGSVTYNSSAYQWCQAAPGGNLYDCMAVQYWGGGVESGIGSDLAGTAYDRGQLFRGGITNGELYDTGVLDEELDLNRLEGLRRNCFAFTVYYWNKSIVPSNNITNYYYRYWTSDDWWSDYLGTTQSRTFDYQYLFDWEYDQVSQSRDWTEVDDTRISVENKVLSVGNNTFNYETDSSSGTNYGGQYNQSLLVGYQEGFEHDVDNDQIYDFGFYTDGRWTNQQIGKYQQGFVIFNLPDNSTLQGLDSDNDGLTDFNELFVYYTNPKYNDTDEDGMTDGAEIVYGYDPNLYTSYDLTAPTVTVVSETFSEDLSYLLNLTTDENATCVYKNETSDYATFQITGNLTHLQNISLELGEYVYYVSCNDSIGYTMNTSYIFIISAAAYELANYTHINVTVNTTEEFNLINGLNITLNLSKTINEEPLAAARYINTPIADFDVSGYTTESYRYYVISSSLNIKNNINKLVVEITYNETRLPSTLEDENDLKFYYYNTSASEWQEEPEYWINETENKVYVNLTHLSAFVLGTITKVVEETSSSEEASVSSTEASASSSCAPGLSLIEGQCQKIKEEITKPQELEEKPKEEEKSKKAFQKPKEEEKTILEKQALVGKSFWQNFLFLGKDYSLSWFIFVISLMLISLFFLFRKKKIKNVVKSKIGVVGRKRVVSKTVKKKTTNRKKIVKKKTIKKVISKLKVVKKKKQEKKR